jgi:beta-glucanase (GH16 family)
MLPHKNHLLTVLALCVLAIGVVAAQASAAVTASSNVAKARVFTHRTYIDQFNGPLKAHSWTLYNGQPTCCPDSGWAKSHVVAENGALRIRTYRDPARGNKWISGGVSMARMVNQTYGRWVVRFRMPRGTGVGMDVALRPKGNGTVVDWIEESSKYSTKRDTETATLHYGNTRVHAKVHANFTKWHTMVLRWIPNRITVRLDGKTWAHYTSHIPSVPMHLVMQTNVGSNGFSGMMPNASTPQRVALQVDRVAVYRYK